MITPTVPELASEQASIVISRLVWRYAHRTYKDGHLALWTSGTSALEDAFEWLGWEDPHIVPVRVTMHVIDREGVPGPERGEE